MPATVENDTFRVGATDGALTDLYVKPWGEQLVREPDLAGSFRVNLPLEGALDHYVEGVEQDVTVTADGERLELRVGEFVTDEGTFDVSATFAVVLDGDECRFSCAVENGTDRPLAEVWFPVLGGLRGIGDRMDTEVTAPGYHDGLIDHDVFRAFYGDFFGNRGGYAALTYPDRLTMPWLHVANPERDRGLYVGRHDETCRTTSFVSHLSPGYRGTQLTNYNHRGPLDDTWPAPEEVPDDEPLGLTLSTVAYPHTTRGTFEPGDTVLRTGGADWHEAADYYREWFDEHFEVPGADERGWLRAEQAWFTSILKQPEDRVVGDYEDYADWLETATEYGVTTGELIGWDDGGLERNYPEYVPDDELGGRDGYQDLVEDVHDADATLLTFVNYHVLDSATDDYDADLHRFRRQNSYGNSENPYAWGESTLKAALGLDVRRHVLASPAVEAYRDLIESYVLDLVEAGTDGLQIDKLIAGGLDFNPNHDASPDTALAEELVAAVRRLYERARERNPDFALAGEAGMDRFVPFVDVFYRAATARAVSPLRYAFPEWTTCVHCSSPYDYEAVNGALVFGAVLVVEPHQYTAPMDDPTFEPMAEYVEACLSLREQYRDRIFLADYRDTRGATVETSAADLVWAVHADEDGRKALVVANHDRDRATYEYAVPGDGDLRLDRPLGDAERVPREGELEIPGERVQVLLER